MKTADFSRKVIPVLVLLIVFTLLPLTLTYAQVRVEPCASTGVTPTGCDATTGRSSGAPLGLPGGYSDAGSTLSIHSAYAEYSEESSYAGFTFNTNDTGQTIFVGTGIGKRGNSIEITLTMADVSKLSDFLISAKYQFLGETSSRPAMAVGVDAINEIAGQMERSPYIVASKSFPKAELPSVASLGWGSGRFRDSLFGGLAFILQKHWNFIVEYDGLGGNIGTSFATKMSLGRPFPVVITLTVNNAFASEEESVFGIAAGITFH